MLSFLWRGREGRDGGGVGVAERGRKEERKVAILRPQLPCIVGEEMF